jgi:hypothetical protein
VNLAAGFVARVVASSERQIKQPLHAADCSNRDWLRAHPLSFPPSRSIVMVFARWIEIDRFSPSA